MENPESAGTPYNDPLRAELRRQMRAEIDGESLTNAERFALEQKYGLHEPTVHYDDVTYAAKVLGVSVEQFMSGEAEVVSGR